MRSCGSALPPNGHSGELRPTRCSQSGELPCQPVAQLVRARRASGVGAATATCRTAVLPSARPCERRAMNLVRADGAAINEACDRCAEFGAKLAIWRIALIASARRRQPSIGWPRVRESRARDLPGLIALTTLSYAAHTCGRGRRPRGNRNSARGCRHERHVRRTWLACQEEPMAPQRGGGGEAEARRERPSDTSRRDTAEPVCNRGGQKVWKSQFVDGNARRGHGS